MRLKVYSSAVFTGIDLFALKFYLDRVVPINHSWHQKTRDTGLPGCDDRILLRSLLLTQYWSVTDRQTNGRICRSTALAKLVLRRAVYSNIDVHMSLKSISSLHCQCHHATNLPHEL